MFDFLFAWRKATHCKKLVTRLQIRLNILRNKKQHIVKQHRQDIAQLLRNGQCDAAFSRVEQLFADQCLLTIYELLDNYCEFVSVHLPYIRTHKKCPDDIKEAISTLLFAAAYLGDLPELRVIKKLFTERYVRKFAKAAAESGPGSLVNHEVEEKLCMKSAPDHDVKIKLINEIADDYMLKLQYIWHDNKLKPELTQLTQVGTRSDKFQEQSIFSTLQEVEEFKHGEEKRIFVFITSIKHNCGCSLMSRSNRKEPNIGNQTETLLGIEQEIEEELFDCSNYGSCSRGSVSSCVESETGRIVPYLGKIRQLNERGRERIMQTSRTHVHPKLPDYDELVAKFQSLKKEYQQRIIAPGSGRF